MPLLLKGNTRTHAHTHRHFIASADWPFMTASQTSPSSTREIRRSTTTWSTLRSWWVPFSSSKERAQRKNQQGAPCFSLATSPQLELLTNICKLWWSEFCRIFCLECPNWFILFCYYLFKCRALNRDKITLMYLLPAFLLNSTWLPTRWEWFDTAKATSWVSLPSFFFFILQIFFSRSTSSFLTWGAASERLRH